MEILAPAGSVDALITAVSNCADAVYLGVEKLNARLKADNFTTQNLKYWVDYCHLRNVKVYLTLNTLVKDDELETAKEIVLCAREARVDAFIVADLAVLKICKELAPSIALHASTQMGIHNLLGARFIQSLGVKRVVLSREATLDEITAIKQNTKLEIEYFAHGALCVAFSGGCLFSSVSSGKSGNRGRCLQLCRKEYSNSLNGKSMYYLSPKDQCLIDKLQELKKAGVDCIKIEGRMRSADYVGATVCAYNKILRGNKVSNDDRYKLSVAFNRGNFTTGYSFEKTKSIMFPYIQGHYGVEIGEIIACKKSQANYLITARLKRAMPQSFGAKIICNNKEHDGGEIIANVMQNNQISFGWKTSLPVGAKIHATTDNSLGFAKEKKLKIAMTFNATINNSLYLSVKYDNIEVNNNSEFVCAKANNQPITKEQLIKQLCKTGDTCFEICLIDGNLDENIFIPNGVINNLRRDILNSLQSEILANYNNQIDISAQSESVSLPKCEDISQTILETRRLPKQLNRQYTYVLEFSNELPSIIKNSLIYNNLYIKLPKIALEKDCNKIMQTLQDIPNNIGIYADNYYAIQLAKDINRSVIYGFGLNILNRITADFYKQNYCISQELNSKEISFIKNGYAYVYGFLPIMTLAHCPYQLVSGENCATCNYKDFEYFDNYGSYKLSRTKVVNCQFTLDNSNCHDLTDKGIQKSYYDLRRYTAQELQDIDIKKLKKYDNYTLGHFNRGVD